MQIKSKYNIYKVFDGYKFPHRELYVSVYSKKEAEEITRYITQKGLDIMGRINHWGEKEWAGFCIV
jgi:hypothetical protein